MDRHNVRVLDANVVDEDVSEHNLGRNDAICGTGAKAFCQEQDDSDTPHGIDLLLAKCFCARTADCVVSSKIVFGYVFIHNIGIKYSNIVPVHESSTRSFSYSVNLRSNVSQLSFGMSPLAMATNVAARASEGSKS